MDSLHLCIALGPLAMYLLVIGALNCTRRPFVTSGARDTAALGMAISGLVVAGPLELFFPDDAAAEFGGVWFVWLLLLVLYTLGLLLTVLLARPRLVIYNTSPEQLRPVLMRVVQRLDAEAVRAGDTVMLPRLGIQLHVEPVGAMRTAQLVSSGPLQSHVGWRQLEIALAAELRESRGQPSPFGLTMLSVGLGMVLLITFLVVRDPQTVAQSLQDFLR